MTEGYQPPYRFVALCIRGGRSRLRALSAVEWVGELVNVDLETLYMSDFSLNVGVGVVETDVDPEREKHPGLWHFLGRL